MNDGRADPMAPKAPEAPEAPNVTLVYNRIPHHARSSGYDQIGRHLRSRIAVQELDGAMPKFVPRRAWEWLAGRSGMEWYDGWALDLEYVAARRMLAGTGGVYHVLYGENGFRHLGMAKALARRADPRIVATYHQPPQAFDRAVRTTRMLERLDAAIAVARNQMDHLASLVAPERVFLVPHGIDTSAYAPGDESARDGRSFLFVGTWLRDFDMLRDVIRLVGDRDPSITFTIVSSAERAEALAPRANVRLRSGISDPELTALFRSAAAVVVPLTDCTATNSILEGLAFGLPVITTDVGGVRDYVDDGCAFIVPAGDADAMADAVVRLASDPELRRRMGERSRLTALRFDWSTVADQTIAVYRALYGPEPAWDTDGLHTRYAEEDR